MAANDIKIFPDIKTKGWIMKFVKFNAIALKTTNVL